MKYINIGLVGFGNVGRGVYNIINKNKKIYNMMGFNIKIPKICVKDIHKDRNECHNKKQQYAVKSKK